MIAYFSGKIIDFIKFTELLTKIENRLVCCDIDNTLINVNLQLKAKGHDITQYPNPKLCQDFWESYEGLDILAKSQHIKNTIKMLNVFYMNNAEVFLATGRSPKLKDFTCRQIKKIKIKKVIKK